MSDQQHNTSYQSSLRTYFLSGSFHSFIIQGFLYLFTFGTSVLLARFLGAEDYGIYSTVLSWISVFSIFAVLGYDDLLLKKIPGFHLKEHDGSSFWVGYTLKRSVFFSCILIILFALILHFGLFSHFNDNIHIYVASFALIPLFAILHILQSTLRAKRYITLGQLGEKTIQPAFFLLSIGFLFLFKEMNVSNVMIGRSLSFLIAVVFSIYYVVKYVKQDSSYTTTNADLDQSKSSARYFLYLSLIYILISRCDILVLSIFNIPDQMIAYYNAAAKISEVALVPFVILYTVSTPIYSELSANDKLEELQQFYTRSTRFGFIFVLILVIVLLAMSSFLLTLFGDDFVQGLSVLLPLIAAKLLHAFVGPVNYLMMMIGLEKNVTFSSLISLIVTIIFQVYFVQYGGILAVAYATLAGFVLYELLLCIQLYKKTGIIPTIIGQVKL